MSDTELEIRTIVHEVIKPTEYPEIGRELTAREEDAVFLGKVGLAQKLIYALKDKSFYQLSIEELEVRTMVLEVVAEAKGYEIRGQYY